MPTEFFRKFLFGGWFCLFFIWLTEGRTMPRVLARSNIYSEPTKEVPGPEKNYTGLRVRQDSILVTYYHEQTVAVVEVAPNRLLFNCELLEVRTKADKRVALDLLRPLVPVQMRIQFKDMTDLMTECQKLDPPLNFNSNFFKKMRERVSRLRPRQLTSIFSGVFPGTKWCGAGDIASSYHDLGTNKNLDKCCRTHDLCPVKVAGLKTQYNLTNYAIYTRSHCACDDQFYDCLKSVGSTISSFLGGVYFNVAPVTCVEDVPPADPYTKITQKRFTIKNRRF